MWAEAEAAFRRATGSSVVEPNAFNWYSLMLGNVGRFDEALRQVSAGLETFPRSAVLHSRIAIVHAWNGNSDEADLYFERARQLGVGGGSFELAYAVHLIRRKAFADAGHAAVRGVADSGAATDWVQPMISTLQGEADAAEALAALDAAAALRTLGPQVEAMARAILGDVDGAIEVAMSLVQPGQTVDTEFLFLEELRAVQERPEFMQLLTSLRVPEYWQHAGCRWQQLSVHCD
jgi:tetratricopeptide (TPR) repeat protein